MRNVIAFLSANLSGKYHFVELGITGRIILKFFVETGFNWLKIERFNFISKTAA
jgi:hypothetical protein